MLLENAYAIGLSAAGYSDKFEPSQTDLTIIREAMLFIIEQVEFSLDCDPGAMDACRLMRELIS